jgi:glycosyltransferase involved in cell wall biosynthesis
MLIVAPKYGEGPGFYEGAPIYRVSSVPFPPYPQIKLAPVHPGVRHALEGFKPDLIHAVNPFILGWGTPYLSKKFDVPLVASYHTNIADYAKYYGLQVFDGITRWHTRRIHNRATLNLCTSEATRVYLKSQGIGRMHVWPQGVDTVRFNPSKASPWWRDRLSDGHPHDKLLLYVGRLGREKGIERLKAILSSVPDTRLAIVGDGPARRDLEGEFAGTRTVFAGQLLGEELAAAYASADVFLFPSLTETLGMAMIEALASGLPVLAARAGATHEVVDEGVSGLLYEPEAPAALIDAVRTLVGDEELRRRLGRGARAAAEERSWENATGVLRGYYQTALGGS